MHKRVVLISVILAAVVFLTAGYFFLHRSTLAATDPFNAVPLDAAVIVKAVSVADFFSTIRNNSGLWTELGTVFRSGGLVQGTLFLDSLFTHNAAVSELVSGKGLYISLHPEGREKYGVVYYLPLRSKGEIRACNDLMHGLFSGSSPVSQRMYERVRIYDSDFKWKGERHHLSWSVRDGVFMLSLSPVLLENAVKQINSGENVLDDVAFQKVFRTRGSNVDANVFINLENFPRYVSSFTSGESRELLGEFSDFADWAELDLHLRGDVILLNGFSYSDRARDNYLNIFNGQSPLENTSGSVIPGNASAFLSFGLSDIDDFHSKYTGWINNTGRSETYSRLNDDFVQKTGSDLSSSFHSFMQGEISLVLTNWDEPGKTGDNFLVMKTKSRSMASEHLFGMLKHHAASTGKSFDSYRHVYQVDSETSFDIFRFPFNRIGELMFGSVFGLAETSYYSFVNNYLVFGSSVSRISEFINANVRNQTLDADNRFRDFSEYQSSMNNLYFYSHLPRSAGLFTGLFNQELAAGIEENIDSYLKFQALSLQLSSGRDMVYNNIFLKYSPLVIEEPSTYWQTLLDTVIDFKPLLLVNHNTGENEIFIQDLNHVIYLINTAGRILWKKPLPGKIMGDVYQIDYYNNGRLQMLFNTREQIFLLDRNGNDVGRYPLRLPSPATNGISLFDYDNNRDYRIFVACEDKSVVARTKEGNIVSGWNFSQTEHNVYNKIRHFRVSGRDYIVFADAQQVYILNRRGDIRVKPDTMFPVSGRNNIVLESRTPAFDTRLNISDTLGRVWQIYFDGKTEVRSLGDYSADHWFDLQDINADGYRDYIFIDDNRLDVFNREGSLIFSRSFESRIDHPPAYYYFSHEDRKLGVVSAGKGHIYLVDSDGGIYNGFPLEGSSSFTIGPLGSGDGLFQLIVGSNNNFLYNYSVY